MEAFDGYWVPLGWAKEAPILTQSRIDTPTGDVAAGPVPIAGLAWWFSSRPDLQFLIPQSSLISPRKGQIAHAASANGMIYHVRLPEKYDPTAISQSTNDPLIADHRNFYKVEKWTKDGSKVDSTSTRRGRSSRRRSSIGRGSG